MLSLVIGVALAAAAPDVSQPQIVVSGEGQVHLKPDLVTLQYSVTGEGKTSNEAVKALNATTRRVEAALGALDAQIEPLTKNFRVVIIRGEECKEERYDDQLHLSTGKCAIAGYVAEQEFTMRSTRVDEVGTMISAVSHAGADSPRIDEFGLQDRKSARAQAIAKAMEDARTKAQAVAAANGVALGPVIDLELDNARSESIVVTGSRVMRFQEEAPAPIPVKVVPEPVEVTASVKVTYRLGS